MPLVVCGWDREGFSSRIYREGIKLWT